MGGEILFLGDQILFRDGIVAFEPVDPFSLNNCCCRQLKVCDLCDEGLASSIVRVEIFGLSGACPDNACEQLASPVVHDLPSDGPCQWQKIIDPFCSSSITLTLSVNFAGNTIFVIQVAGGPGSVTQYVLSNIDCLGWDRTQIPFNSQSGPNCSATTPFYVEITALDE